MKDKELLYSYRMKQAEETLFDAQKMLENNLSSKSIINRAYYSTFYAILALFLKANTMIKTSKHSGVISTFDKEFVHSGKIEKLYSKILHKLFKIRQEGDYKEFVELTIEDATEAVHHANKFLNKIKQIIEKP